MNLLVPQCKFCTNPPRYAPIQEMEEHDIKVFFCHLCQAEYLTFSNGQLASTSIYHYINNMVYRVTTTKYRTQIWLVKQPGSPGSRINRDLHLIKSFDKILPIHPKNIEEKLQSILTLL